MLYLRRNSTQVSMMNNNRALKIQLLMNLVPLVGVIFANWSVFALIYSYWLETLGISFFNALKIAYAQNANTRPPHILKGIKYFGSQLFLLLFYMIFILVFVGLQISADQEGAHFASYLFFIDPSFRYATLSLLMTKTGELVYEYFLSGKYREASPDEFSGLFSSRTIVIHLVIVLGVFAHQFTTEAFGAQNGIIAFAIVFVAVKSITDIVVPFISKISKKDV